MKRRDLLKFLGSGTASVAMPSMFPWRSLWADGVPQLAPARGGPKRVVFFIQNHGFSPVHARPATIDIMRHDHVEDVPISEHRLPEWIAPLEAIKDKVSIVLGLNGSHVQPYHGGQYGALGGYIKSSVPRAASIDAALARALPAPVPLLGLSWESLSRMRGSPIWYGSSAWSANNAAATYADPRLAYQDIFGAVVSGKARERYDAESAVFGMVRQDIEIAQRNLPLLERKKLQQYLDGLGEVVGSRHGLQKLTKQLSRYQPSITENYDDPLFETDWWEASLEIGIAALQAGVTNVLTIAAGGCASNSSFYGLDLQGSGHNGLGHSNQRTNPDWMVLRQYNMNMLLQIVQGLEAVPEGQGTMMDNTVIVYSSCHGESHHSSGFDWPFLLIGNLGGRLRSGRIVSYPWRKDGRSKQAITKGRSINALYCTLLNAVGVPVQQFNLAGRQDGTVTQGALVELLA